MDLYCTINNTNGVRDHLIHTSIQAIYRLSAFLPNTKRPFKEKTPYTKRTFDLEKNDRKIPRKSRVRRAGGSQACIPLQQYRITGDFRR